MKNQLISQTHLCAIDVFCTLSNLAPNPQYGWIVSPRNRCYQSAFFVG